MSADDPDDPDTPEERESDDVEDVEVTTVHRKEGHDQVTERSVLVDTGDEEIVETFEVVDGDHEYLGDGDPHPRASEELEARF